MCLSMFLHAVRQYLLKGRISITYVLTYETLFIHILYSFWKTGTYFPFQFVWAPNPAVPASFADFYES